MPVSPDAKKRFLAALSAARPIASRPMFGGLGLYHEGVFVAVVDDDRLFLKVDGETEPRYAERGMAAWAISPKAYRELPEEILNAPETCGEWLDAARDAALRRKGKKG